MGSFFSYQSPEAFLPRLQLFSISTSAFCFVSGTHTSEKTKRMALLSINNQNV